MGDGKKLKEILNNKNTFVRQIAKLRELVLQHYILLYKRIPISDLTLPCGWQMNWKLM